MRFVWAVLAFVLAAVLVGAGIAQRSIFLGPKETSAELTVDQPQRYTMIDGDVLRANPGEQTLVAHGDGEILVAQARTADLEAWLSDVSYNRISLGADGAPSAAVVAAKENPVDEKAAASRNPAGSDLWLDSFSDKKSLIDRMQIPEGVSVLVASDGKADAPTDVRVSWPLNNATPWAGPLMVLGGLFFLLGIVLYVLAIRHSRRGRGPRRKGPPPLPATEPIDKVRDELPPSPPATPSAPADGDAEAPADAPATDAPSAPRAERRAAPRRRALLVLPAMGVAAALLSGCSPEIWPQPASSPTPTATETAVADPNAQAPAITEHQAARILTAVSTTLAQADEKLDPTLAATRLDGAALEARKAAYTVRGAVPEFALPATIPPDKVSVIVPQAYDAWPRTVFMVVQHGTDQAVAPLILTMTQADPWSEYKISYTSEMQAKAKLPDMAPAWMGAKLTPPDSPFLAVAPDQLSAAFADVIDNGDKSASASEFDESATKFAQSVRDSRAAVVQALADKGGSTTAGFAFKAQAGTEKPVAMSTLDSGAVVAVSLNDVQTITPSQAGVDITTNASTKALTGLEKSAKGIVNTYNMQLFFSVPAEGSDGKIVLLAVSQQLVSASEVQ